ncbi:MAG: hypothetical protein ACREHE_02395 [Rhizomicrobium sp.]
MKDYAFTIIASGLDPAADDFEDRFFEAGCDDATLSFQKGRIVLEFDRAARSLAEAISSAFMDVSRAGAIVERFEPDHLVSLSDIAARSGLSRAAISLYCKGERGKRFPAPVARVTSESPLWEWPEVARWMCEFGKLPADAVVEADVLRKANSLTQQRAAPAQFAKALKARAA